MIARFGTLHLASVPSHSDSRGYAPLPSATPRSHRQTYISPIYHHGNRKQNRGESP